MSKFQDYRQFLQIDQTDLDGCLMEQPEIYSKVAVEVAQANSVRDQLKLALEELQAKLDQDVRAEAAKSEDRITEAALQNRLRTMPKIQEAQRDYLSAKELAEQWQALKEAFQQRSYMLKELVALYIAQRHDLSMEQGAGQTRAVMAEANREGANKLRRARRGTA